MSSETMNSDHRQMTKKKWMIGSVIGVLFIAMMALVLFEGTKKSVALDADGEQIDIRTHAKTVSDVLAEQEIAIGENDAITPALDTALENGTEIKWEQAKEIAIMIDGKEQKVESVNKTVGALLEEQGITLADYDIVEPSVDTPIQEAEQIDITKAFEVKWVDGGEEEAVWATPMKVGELLRKQEVELGEHDRVEGLAMSSEVTPETVVNITRIELHKEKVEVPTDFIVQEKPDANMFKGETKVLQEGKKGKVEKTFQITVKNGEEVSREVVAENVVESPTNKIVAVGTKVKEQPKETVTPSRDNNAPTGGREFYVEATAYTPYCAGCSGITATGINVRANPNMKLIAVDPRVIPLGSKVWVDGYGYAIAGDTGGAIKGNRIDLLMPTKQQAYSFGRKQVKIKVL